MARFYGKVGYGESIDKGNGVWDIVITERIYSGDVLEFRRNSDTPEKINDDLELSNSVSIVADPYALEHASAIRYVDLLGTLWKVLNVKLESPRLILRLGGVYNGPKVGT